MDKLPYFTLGNVPIWPTREQVDKYMPESFKTRKVHCICTIRVMSIKPTKV